MKAHERNEAARRLLAYFYAAYEQNGCRRNFYITPQSPKVLEEVGMSHAEYLGAMECLRDKDLLKAVTLGGGCELTELGVEASEDEALLGELLPGMTGPLATPVVATKSDPGRGVALTQVPGSDVDIGILTIREDEFRAVLAAFQDGKQLRKLRRHYNIRTADAGSGQTYRVAILRQLEQGNGEAQEAARDMIEELRPGLVLVVGIAGGLPHDDFTLGDVVVSTRINDFSVEARKEGEAPSYNLSGGPIATHIGAGVVNLPALEEELGDWGSGLPPRPSVVVDGAEVKGPPEWQADVHRSLTHHFGDGRSRLPVATAGILASSDRLVKDPAVLFPWIQTARHIWAVDMESAGVYRAARDRAYMLAIRAISDIIGLKRDDRWTKYACASAAAFARAYLRTTPVTPKASSATSKSDPQGASHPPLPTTPSRPDSEPGEAGESWRSPVATLAARSRANVAPISWRLGIELPTPFDGTKAELRDALVAAAVQYDLQNIGRRARWPRVLVMPEAKQRTLPDGSRVWSHSYAEADNEVGDEQLTLTAGGAAYFQRDTLWAVDDPAVDFGALADDVLFGVLFAGRFLNRLGLKNEGAVTLSLRTPGSARGTPAIFHATPVDPEQPHRSARLPAGRPDIGGGIRLPPGSAGGLDGLVAAAKRLLDRVANEFELEATAGGASSDFMAISAPTLARRVQALGVAEPTARPPELALRFETKSMDRNPAGEAFAHHYELIARFTNNTNKRFDDWYIEVELPTLLLEPHTVYGTVVRERSNAERSIFRTSTKLPFIPCGDGYELRLPYRVDHNIFWNHRQTLEGAIARARAFVDGGLVAEATLTTIQNF